MAHPNNDVIAKASGGRALVGMTFITAPQANPAASVAVKQQLLRLPTEDVTLDNPLEPSKSVTYCFSTSQESDSFSRDVKEMGWSLAGKLHAEFLWFKAEASGKRTSHEVQQEGSRLHSKATEACIVRCIYVPTKCFRIPKQRMMLSDAALEQALAIRNPIQADDFLKSFNPFVSTGVYHLGGIFLRQFSVKSNEEASLYELMRQAETQLSGSANVSGSIGRLTVGASGEGSRSSRDERQASEGRCSSVQVGEERVHVYGPTTARSEEEFLEMMNTGDRDHWSITDQAVDEEGSIVAVWELLLQQHSAVAAGDNAMIAAKILCDRWIYLHKEAAQQAPGSLSLPHVANYSQLPQSLLRPLVNKAEYFIDSNLRHLPSRSLPLPTPTPDITLSITLPKLIQRLKEWDHDDPLNKQRVASLIRDYIQTHSTSSDRKSENSRAVDVLCKSGFDRKTGNYLRDVKLDGQNMRAIIQKLEEVIHPSQQARPHDAVPVPRAIEWREAIKDISMLCWPHSNQEPTSSTFHYVGHVVADKSNHDTPMRSIGNGGQDSLSNLAIRFIDCLRHRLDDPKTHLFPDPSP